MSKAKKIRRMSQQGPSPRDDNAMRMRVKHELERLVGDRPAKRKKA